MPREHCQVTFCFDPAVPLDEVDGTLRLSLMATESLHGYDRLRLEPATSIDREHRTCVIHTTTAVGRSLAAIFLGYARREFGEDAVRMLHPGGGTR